MNPFLLRELLLDGDKACELYIHYKPDLSKVEISEIINKISGSKIVEKQMASTETDLVWHPFLYNEEIFIVSNPTQFKLTLIGLEENSVQLNNFRKRQYAGLYNHSEFGIKSRPITRQVFEQLPRFLKEVVGNYWLEDKNNHSWVRSYKPKMSKLEIIAGFDNVIDYSVCYSDALSKISSKSMRMFAKLPRNIKVDMSNLDGKTLSTALELFI